MSKSKGRQEEKCISKSNTKKKISSAEKYASSLTQEIISAMEIENECKTPILGRDDKKKYEMDAFSANQHYMHMKTAIDGYVSKVIGKGVKGLLEDFTSIRVTAAPDNDEISQWIANPTLNRYKNILCWDESRVVLKDHPDGLSYIHANVVGGPLYPDRFVCAQGPLRDTCFDFWLMIFEQKIMSILQLCRFEEDGAEKCAIYYPQNKGDTMQFRDISIKCMDVKQLGTPGTVYQRVFQVYKGQQGKDVYHLSFETWPDHGVPSADTTLLTVLQKLRMSTNFPILVHCSAGIGRTGTVVAIENILESIMLGKSVESHEVVEKLRTQRRQSVQREAQFLFINRLVIEYFLQMKQIELTPEIEAFFEEYEKAIAVRK